MCALSLSLHSVSSSPIYPSVSSARSGKIWNLAGDKLKTDDGSGKCGGEPLRTDQTDKDKAEGGAMCQGKAHSKRGMVESWQQNGGQNIADLFVSISLILQRYGDREGPKMVRVGFCEVPPCVQSCCLAFSQKVKK